MNGPTKFSWGAAVWSVVRESLIGARAVATWVSGLIVFLFAACGSALIGPATSPLGMAVMFGGGLLGAGCGWLVWPWIEDSVGVDRMVDEAVDGPRSRAAEIEDGSRGILDGRPFVGEPDEVRVVRLGRPAGKHRAGVR